MVAALGMLARGGNMLLKAFTLFEHSTLAMLHLMGALFDELPRLQACNQQAWQQRDLHHCQRLH